MDDEVKMSDDKKNLLQLESHNEFFNITPNLLCITDKDLILKEVSPSFSYLFNLEAKDILKKSFLDIVHPKDKGQTEFELSKLIQKKIAIQFTSRVILNQEEFITVTWFCSYVVSQDSYYFLGQDISALVDSEKKLQKLLAIHSATSSIAKIGGWELLVETGELNWTDETFKILDVAKLHGQKPVLPEGLSLFTDEYKPIMENAVSRAIEFGEAYSLEVQAQTEKGNVFWVYTNGKAKYLDDKVVSLSGTIQNIDERKKAELSALEERESSLHSAKLASLGEMSAGIAHEINNPLAIINGTIALFQRVPQSPEKFEKHLETMHKACIRIEKIVKGLKKYSRKDSEHTKGPHKLIDIINEAFVLTAAPIKKSNTKIEIDSEIDEILTCNEVEIEQVLINLINNSIDAISDLEERWIKIVISTIPTGIELKFIDSGSGIPSEIAENLFNPFFTTKDVGKGTGLGLSITTRILEEHNATIEVDHSHPNTCFVIKFNTVDPR